MQTRLEYMIENNISRLNKDVIEYYDDCIVKLQTALLWSIKYNMIHDTNLLTNIRHIINNAVMQDKCILGDIVKCL